MPQFALFSKPTESINHTQSALHRYVFRILSEGSPTNWRELFDAARADGMDESTAKDIYEQMELEINRYLISKLKTEPNSITSPTTAIRALTLLGQLPTETKRDHEQVVLDQFSTPPDLAAVMAWAANIQPADIVLDPSAGNGNLVVQAGFYRPAKLVAGEISDRRRDNLHALQPELSSAGLSFEVFNINAASCDALYPAKGINPSVILMNPPFKHVRQHVVKALSLLPAGGRLVTLVSPGSGFSTDAGSEWWRKAFRLNLWHGSALSVALDGEFFRKFGTNFGTEIIVVDKGIEASTKRICMQYRAEQAQDLESLRTVMGEPAPRFASQPSKPKGQGRVIEFPDALNPVDKGANHRSVSYSRYKRRGAPGSPGGAVVDAKEPVTDLRSRTQTSRKGTALVKPVAFDFSAIIDSIRAQPMLPHPAYSPPSKANGGEVYQQWRATYVYPDATVHPTPLCASTALGHAPLPKPAEKALLPQALATNGNLSAAQLEVVTLAAIAHAQAVQTKTHKIRRGFMIGDGTGVGKGATNAGIILAGFLAPNGCRRAVWVTANTELFEDAKRDLARVGLPPAICIAQKDTSAQGVLPDRDGILLTTYSTLRTSSQPKNEGDVVAAPVARWEQALHWLGVERDADGEYLNTEKAPDIIYDEAHCMQNALAVRGNRGMTTPSAQALAAMKLEKALPNAKVVYVSATGFSDVPHIAYAGERLGLWGLDKPFADVNYFVEQIGRAGLVGMEETARHMVAQGVYVARSLSFDGVSYEQLVHTLSPEQRALYDELAQAWQLVLREVGHALVLTGVVSSGVDGKTRTDGQAKSAALSAFWGAHQRFFLHLLTAMQMPTVIQRIRDELDAGNAAVIQLVNTNEAVQARRLADAAEAGLSLADVRLTPLDILMDYIQDSFPIAAREGQVDAEGNTFSTRVLTDEEGSVIAQPAALSKRDELLMKLGALQAPEGPLEQLFEAFGSDAIAEITGRTRRLVRRAGKATIESRSRSARAADLEDFRADKKKILIFSNAGGTGASYHANKDIRNQRPRRHFVLQPGWSPDKAIQGIGRTHRTNQASAPHYLLCTVDLAAFKRFTSSIARRMGQLGALTQGRRDGKAGELFDPADNLETRYASEAVNRLIDNIKRGRVEGFSLQTLDNEMGLDLADDTRTYNRAKDVPITQFLNRMLSMTTDRMDELFKLFMSRLSKEISYAKEQGVYVESLSTLRAKSIEVVESEPANIAGLAKGAVTYMKLRLTRLTRPMRFDRLPLERSDVQFMHARDNPEMLCLVYKSGEGFNWKTNKQVERYSRLFPNGRTERFESRWEAKQGFDTVYDNEGDYSACNPLREEWEAQAVPREVTETRHVVTGDMLSVWDRLPKIDVNVRRVPLANGESFIGRMIPSGDVKKTLQQLQIATKVEVLSPEKWSRRVLDDKMAITLSNGMILRRSLTNNQLRIEVTNHGGYRETERLRLRGMVLELISSVTRVFIPHGNEARILTGLLKVAPVVSVDE